MKSSECEGCGSQTTSCWRLCRACKSAHHHAHERIEREGLLVDTAGGSWWVWTKSGEVLVIGKESKAAAIMALALGEDAERDAA